MRVIGKGIVVLIDGTNSIIWSLNSSRSVMCPVAKLLGSGNLVIRFENDCDPENFIWQSFGHPAGSLLPDMKIGWIVQFRFGLWDDI